MDGNQGFDLDLNWKIISNLIKLNTMFGLAGAMPNINNFSSKADALKFAIEFTSSSDMSGSRTFDKEKAQELFEFICKNVELPDTPLTQWKDVINQADDIAKMIKEYLVQTINAQKANENTAK